MEPKSSICLFFQSLNTKHLISISPINSEMTLKTEIFNTQSLLTQSPLQTFLTEQTHSFNDNEPFFLRLSAKSEETKTFRVSLVSVKIPILYSKCKAEQVQPIFNIDSAGNRHQHPDIQSTQCINVIDELKQFLIVIILIACLFILIIVILHFCGCISIRFFCGKSQFQARFDGPKKGVISTSHKNSMDIDAPINNHSDSELLT